MRKLILFKSARDAKAVFSVRAMGGKAYHTQLRHETKDGDTVQYGYGTDFLELKARFAGTRWDEVSWRWPAPEELKAYFATLTNGVAIA